MSLKEILILGCGSSTGVPVIGCKCNVCTSRNSKNRRFRSSILIKSEGHNLLVDAGPDLRIQALNNNITSVDSVICTHTHDDHIGGINDLKLFAFAASRSLDFFAHRNTLSELENKYHHMFSNEYFDHLDYVPLIGKRIEYGSEVAIGPHKVKLFMQHHGIYESTGIKIKDFVYSTDVIEFPQESEEQLWGLKLWILSCLSRKESKNHAHLAKVLSWIEKFKPEQVVLTHLGHGLEYEELSKELPKNVTVAHDGMMIKYIDS